MTRISEAFTHEPDSAPFTDFQKATPAKRRLNPAMDEEHHHLKKLQETPRNPGHTAEILNHTYSSRNLNSELAYSETPLHFHEQKAQKLSSAITDNLKPLEHEHHVYSGLGGYDPHLIFSAANGVFKAKHFVSGSIDPAIATQHDNLKTMLQDGEESHVVHFHLPKGYAKARYIAHISEFPGEHEMLFDRDQHWKLTGTHTIRSTHPVTGRAHHRTIWSVVPHESPATVREIFSPVSPEHIKQHLKIIAKTSHYPYMADDDWDHLKSEFPNDHHVIDHAEVTAHHEKMLSLHEHLYSLNDNRTIKKYTNGETGMNSELIESGQVAEGNWQHGHYQGMKDIFKHKLDLDHDAHVYSGIGFDPTKHFKEHDGVFHSPAFISTSLNPHVALGIGSSNYGMDSHVLHFQLPKGYSKGAYFGGNGNVLFKNQRELVLDHKQNFKLVGHKTYTQPKGTGRFSSSTHAKKVNIWTVVPHDTATVREELEHDGKLYFDDAHPGMADIEWGNHAEKHPNTSQFLDHKEAIKTLAVSKMSRVKNIPTYPPKQDGFLGHYTRGSSTINGHLLGSIAPFDYDMHQKAYNRSVQDTVDGVSAAIKKHAMPLDHTLHVYSGTNHPHLQNGTIGIGDTVHTPAFTSTSIKHTIAKGFGWNHIDPEGTDTAHHIIHFELPAGYNQGTYVEPHSWISHECEYLLDKNQKWKITNHETFKTRDPQYSHEPKIIDRHVWTVVPHSEKTIGEALEHDPKMFARKQVDAYIGKRAINKVNIPYHDAAKVGDDHDVVMRRNHDYTPSLPEKNDIESYTRHQSETINNHLLGVAGYVGGHSQERAENLSNIIKKHVKPLDHEAHVYSGVGFDPSEHFRHGDGVIHMPAFTSTSLNVTTPHEFGKQFNKKKTETTTERTPRAISMNHDNTSSFTPDKASLFKSHADVEKHVIHFKLPVGYTRGLYIRPHSRYQEEHEFLLDKDQKWKLEKHEVVNSWQSSRSDEAYPWLPEGQRSHIRHTYTSKTRRHIWTVVPHDDKPITEALVHVPGLFHPGSMYIDSDHDAYKHHDKTADVRRQVRQNYVMQEQIGNVHDKHLREHNSYTLNADENERIRDYTGAMSEPLNTHLIHPLGTSDRNRAEEYEHRAANLSDIIHKYAKPLDAESHFYSAVGFNPSGHFKHGDGTIHLPSFISSSANPNISSSFGGGTATKYKTVKSDMKPKKSLYAPAGVTTRELSTRHWDHHIIHFKTPVGYSKGLYIAPHSRIKGEHEFLFDKGQKWKLEKHEVLHGTASNRNDVLRYGEGEGEFYDHQYRAKQTQKTHVRRHIWTVVPHTDSP